jgi:hypothetical protein
MPAPVALTMAADTLLRQCTHDAKSPYLSNHSRLASLRFIT